MDKFKSQRVKCEKYEMNNVAIKKKVIKSWKIVVKDEKDSCKGNNMCTTF